MNEREAAVHFYEMLTGVFNDDQSKLIRYVCFAVLFVGMVWAGFNYFRAIVLADTETPLDEDMFQDTRPPGNEAALQRVVDLAQTLDTMRSAGSSIAATLNGIHSMPFNLDPVMPETMPASVPETDNVYIPPAQVPEANHAVPMTVRMIMTDENGRRIAVVDAGGKRAVVLKRGDEVPGGGGFVRSIRPDGITVIVDKKEVKYEVPKIPIFTEIKTPGKKSN